MIDSQFDLRVRPNDYYKKPRVEMVEYIPRFAKKILDIGCGEGCFAGIIRKHGMEIWGVEVSRESATIALHTLDKVIVGDICEVAESLPLGYFDCIIFNDILEHVVDPYSLLEEMKGKLTNSGVVVCSIPNVRYFGNLKKLLIEKTWKYEDQGVLDKSHLRFFTEKSIRETFTLLGFLIIKLRGINKLSLSWKFKLLNLILLGHLSDAKYPQFVCVARVDRRVKDEKVLGNKVHRECNRAIT